ncbi:MAG: hypothetical protein ACREJD_10570 [Phycisphaerales bacterium]
MINKLSARLAFPVLVATATLGWGCAGTSDVAGRVIAGPANVVTVLEENDPRFKADGTGASTGVGGTSVVIRRFAGEGQNGPIIGTGVSAPTGEFKIPITDKDAERYEMVVTATTTDKRISRGRIYFPATGKQVLVVVRDVK